MVLRKFFAKIYKKISSRIRAEKEQSLSLILALPEDAIVDILARVLRCHYPTLSLVSKHFRSLVASPELYARRSLLGCSEHCLCLVLEVNGYERLYVLNRKANGNIHLVLLRSLPDLRRIESIVAVGSKIYLFGRICYRDKTLYPLSIIDCRSDTVQPLPSMPIPMSDTMADIIDVIGYGRCYYDGWKKVMVVFNTETQKWEEPRVIKIDIELGDTWPRWVGVMADKLYTRDDDNSYVYEPKGNKWETDDMLNLKKWNNASVVDDVLYYYDSAENSLYAYDPKQRCWGVVKGVEKLFAEMKSCSRFFGSDERCGRIPAGLAKTLSYGGRLALFFPQEDEEGKELEIWCAEVSLERRQGGEIWGQVEWCDVVVPGKHFLLKPLAVTV